MKAQAAKKEKPAARGDRAAAAAVRTVTPIPMNEVGLQREACACGGGCPRCRGDSDPPTPPEVTWRQPALLQAKLAVGATDDPLEREADRIADQVMATPAPHAVGNAPQRIQRFSTQSNVSVEAVPASVDRALASPGRQLESALRQDMEQRFGHDFSRVRVHSGAASEQSARDVNANAYTVGSNIVFGAGQLTPETHEGRRLIAHELTHVVQQSKSAPAIQRQPDVDLEAEAEAEAQYREDERQDKQGDKQKQERGKRAQAPTAQGVSSEAEKNIKRMIKEAEESRKTGSGRTTDIPKQQKLTNEFRRYLDQYRAAEIDQIDEKLKKLPKGREREQLKKQKRAIVNERVDFQYKFDEALRTPRGAERQGKYVRGAPGRPYHDIDDPRRGGYAQPDYTIAKPTAGGTVVIHVNLKSHDLRDIKPGDARSIAKQVLAQAVKNVSGDQARRGPQLGHLPPTDKLVISFVDMPPKAIRDEMNAIMLGKNSPIHEARYGTVTDPNPHIKTPPAKAVGTSGSSPDTGKPPPADSGKLPKGSVFEKSGSPLPKSVIETTGQPPLPKDSVFNIKTPDAPATSSATTTGATTTSMKKGRVTVDFDPKAPGYKNMVKRVRIDVSDLPPLPKTGGAGGMGPKMVNMVSAGEMMAGLYGEAAGGETQKNIEKIIDPIKSHFRGKLEDARVEFHSNYPAVSFLKQAAGLEDLRTAYEAAMKRTKIPEAQRAWLALAIALSVDNPKVSQEDLQRMVESYKSGQWAPTGAQLDKLEGARQGYEDTVYLVQAQIQQYDRELMKAHAENIAKRAGILLDAGQSLSDTFWGLMQTVGSIPFVYYELWPIYDKATLFMELGAGMNAFAGEIRGRALEYEQAIKALDQTLFDVGLTRFKGLYREPRK